MAIDLGLVIAQLVNFALLLLVLQRFLFRPVARVMEERAKAIAREVDDAARARAGAEADRGALAAALAAAPEERRELLAQAESDAAALRARRLADLDAEAARERARLEAERVRADRDREERLATLIAPLLRTALERSWRELVDEDVGRAARRTFIAHLQRLDDGERAALAHAARAGPLRVAVAPAPTPADTAALRDALHATLAIPTDVAIDTDPDLIAGVVLCAGDLRLEWSASAHLQDLERVWRTALAPGGGVVPWNAPKPTI